MSQEIREAMEQQIYPFMKELFWRIAEEKNGLTMDGVWVYNEKAQFVGGKAINLCSYVVTELLDEKELFWRIAEEKNGLTMDGVWVYNEKAQFVGGKAINLCSYVVTELLDEKEKQEGIPALKEIIPMCAELPMQTWGIFNAVKGLYRLKEKNMHRSVIDPDVWEKLKNILDWRTFVDCENHLALKGYSTNYYGVAFGIARYRELLGWEDEEYSKKLLDRFMEHIQLYSGEYEFMDETPGDGRFDRYRYSILVPAEIANTVMDTGMELPEKIISMLKKSTAICLFMANRDGYGFSYGRSTGAYGDTGVLEVLTATVMDTGMELPEKIISMLKKSTAICLFMANRDGYGFSYGRSIGAYGDTGVLEVLTAAYKVKNILSEEEKRLAYAYCVALIRRFGKFWIDPAMRSVNMWEKGRRTDSYRNKNRILSENLSLCMQILEATEWESPCAGEEDMEMIWKHREQQNDSYRNKNRILSENLSLCMQILEATEWESPCAGEEDMEMIWKHREQQNLQSMICPFAKGEYERALVLVRDGRRVWSLPFISGGSAYFAKSPYFPIPYSQFAVTGVPGEEYAYLVPQIILEDGKRLMPIVYFKEIHVDSSENQVIVSSKQDVMCEMGKEQMQPYKGIRCQTVYTFQPGKIQRSDTFYVERAPFIRKIQMDVLTFSDHASEIKDGIEFEKGIVRKFTQKGFDKQHIIQGNNQENYRTPEGGLSYHIQWETEEGKLTEPSVEWEMEYKKGE